MFDVIIFKMRGTKNIKMFIVSMKIYYNIYNISSALNIMTLGHLIIPFNK